MGGGAAEREEQDGYKWGFGEPEGVVGEARGDEGSGDGSEEEGEADGEEFEGFGAALVAEGGVPGKEMVEGTFGSVAEIAGDEGGVVGEAADAAEGGDLEGRNEGDGDGEEGLGRRRREEADDVKADNLD